MITVKPATLRDLKEYHKIARPEDLEEVQITTEHAFLEQPVEAFTSYDTQAIRHETSGDLLGLAGINRTGHIWMILTTHIYNHRIEFLRFSKWALKELLMDFPRLHNITLRKNHLHIEWLRWLGAKFETVEDPKFVKFILKKKRGDNECATSGLSCRQH